VAKERQSIMEIHYNISPKADKIINTLKEEMGYKTQSEAINFTLVVAEYFINKHCMMVKIPKGDYRGELEYHYRPASACATLIGQCEDITQSEFINYMISEIFKRCWIDGEVY